MVALPVQRPTALLFQPVPFPKCLTCLLDGGPSVRSPSEHDSPPLLASLSLVNTGALPPTDALGPERLAFIVPIPPWPGQRSPFAPKVLGSAGTTRHPDSIPIGPDSFAYESDSIPIGPGSFAYESDSFPIGPDSFAYESDSFPIGPDSIAYESDSIGCGTS